MVVRHGNVIIKVDFNYCDIDWADRTARSSKAHHFFNFLQHTDLIADVDVNDNLGNSDHRVIMFNVNDRKRRPEGRTTTLYFKRDNFTKLCSILHDIKWNTCFKCILNNGISQCQWTSNTKEIKFNLDG